MEPFRAVWVSRFARVGLVAAALTVGVAVGPGAGTAHATEVGIQRPFGIGLVAGSAPGLTAKIWTRSTNAVDLGLGFGLGDFACHRRFNPCGETTSFHADYLWQSGHGPSDSLSLHVGLGARVWFYDYGPGNDNFRVAGRVPLGVDLYLFDWFEAFAEITPTLAFDPSYFFFEGAIGFRIYL